MTTKRGLHVQMAAALGACVLLASGRGAMARGDWSARGEGTRLVPASIEGEDSGQEPTPGSEAPQIDVVFVLDTTGSMSGLIRAAKEKIWSVATTLARTDPAPDIRMGLVAYRDRGDEYVTRRTDLSADLDAVYSRLMGFEARGGGDTPESVNQALNEAVSLMSWRAGQNVYRAVFVVGDCPPHMDYPDDVKYEDSCRAAVAAGIVVNSIQCGSNSSTTTSWKAIASTGGGNFLRVSQSGGAVLASTPHDAELAKLSRELDATRVSYGSAEEREHQRLREERADKIAERSSVMSAATRAVFNASAAGERNFSAVSDLVTDMKKGKVTLAKVADEKLPEPMRAMKEAERAAYVKLKSERRADVVARIEEVSRKRQQHIRDQMKAAGRKLKDTFEQNVYETVKKQAKACDIEYDAPCASF